jgi:integrase
MKTLSQAQLNQIEKALISAHHKRCFAIAKYTGQKIKVILNLKVSDVYNEYRQPLAYIHFSGARIKPHKAIVFDALQIALIRYAPENFIHDNWLFPSRQLKGKPLTFSSINKAFLSAVERTNLYHLEPSMKNIRESFIQHLYDQGIHFHIVCKILGSVPEYRPKNQPELSLDQIAKMLENIFHV